MSGVKWFLGQEMMGFDNFEYLITSFGQATSEATLWVGLIGFGASIWVLLMVSCFSVYGHAGPSDCVFEIFKIGIGPP